MEIEIACSIEDKIKLKQKDISRVIKYKDIDVNILGSDEDSILYLDSLRFSTKQFIISISDFNINKYLTNIYQNSGMEHLVIQPELNKKCNGYKDNIDNNCLINIIEKDVNRKNSIKEILNQYNSVNFDKTISYSKLYYSIKKLGYSNVKLNKVNDIVSSSESKKYQKIIVKFLLKHMYEGYIILFVDECPLSKGITKTKGLINKNMNTIISSGYKRIEKLTLISIISNFNFQFWDYFSGNVNSIKFWEFMNRAVNTFRTNELFEQKLKDRRIIVFLDNCKIHYNQFERSKNLHINIQVLYNIEYCCHINSVEYSFFKLKQYLKKKYINCTNDLKKYAEEYLQSKLYHESNLYLYIASKAWNDILLDKRF